MIEAAARLCLAARSLCRAAFPASFGMAMLGVAACSTPGPPPAQYVLGGMPAATSSTVVQTGVPIVEIRRVQVPDYLDTTDILQRKGNQLIASPTSRWAERLSVGLTRALAASLAGRLAGMQVTTTPPVGRPAWQIFVDVAGFEARDDFAVVLVVRWTITDGVSREVLVSKQASLVEAVAGTGDGAVVAAMSHIVENLAADLAAGIEGRPQGAHNI